MKRVNRRTFVSSSLGVAAALSLPGSAIAAAAQHAPGNPQEVPGIVDTNVHLFDWPFRKLKYASTDALLAKLRKHRIEQAWAGSYEAVFHKDISGVNMRLAAECRAHGAGRIRLRVEVGRDRKREGEAAGEQSHLLHAQPFD